jgi:hypothetical protein
MTSTSRKPYARANSVRSYWRRRLSRCSRTCAVVDWRTYTTARRLSTLEGNSLGIIASLAVSRWPHGLQQQTRERGDDAPASVAVEGKDPLPLQRKRHLRCRRRLAG